MNNIGPTLHSGRPRVVAFGGGKGGAGRSTICSEVARSMARQNHRILCVDAAFEVATLNTLLHTAEPHFEFDEHRPPLGTDEAHVADFIEETGHKNIWLLSLAPARAYPFTRPSMAADILLDQLHQLDFEWVFIDLPPGMDPLSVGLFSLSDVPVLVATPEPAAIRLTAQYLRASLYQAIGYHPNAFDFSDDLLDTLYQQPLNLSRDSLLKVAPTAEAREIVTQTLERLEAYLIVNMVREGAERDLGFVLNHACYESLGIFPRFLGSVDYEDRRWFYNRRTAGSANTIRGEEALSNDIEALARHISDLRLIDSKYPRPLPRGPDVHPALRIGLHPETGRNEIRQACRRLWEGYRREPSIALMFDDSERRLEIADQLEHTYRKVLTLQSDLFNQNDFKPKRESRETTADSSNETRTTPEPGRPRADTPPDDDTYEYQPVKGEKSPGRLIETLRRQKGMSLQELSLRTHIGIKYLAAIEDADVEILPRPVYLRGYLREIARIFDVDATELISQYFRFLGEE